MWREKSPSGDYDYAISFETATACLSIWDSIGDIQKQYLQHCEYGISPNFNTDINPTQPTKTYIKVSTRLPDISRNTLPDLKRIMINSGMNSHDRDILVQELLANVSIYSIILSF